MIVESRYRIYEYNRVIFIAQSSNGFAKSSNGAEKSSNGVEKPLRTQNILHGRSTYIFVDRLARLAGLGGVELD
jgi:hypothetical protein